MKKGLKKLGIGLIALGLAGGVQEGLATTQKQTNDKVLEVLEKNEKKSINTSNTYTTTATNFEKQENSPLDMTELVKMVADSTKQLENFYGKEGLDLRFHEINQKYPDFSKLSEKEKEAIIREYFGEGIVETSDDTIMLFMTSLLLLLYGIYIDAKRRTLQYRK